MRMVPKMAYGWYWWCGVYFAAIFLSRLYCVFFLFALSLLAGRKVKVVSCVLRDRSTCSRIRRQYTASKKVLVWLRSAFTLTLVRITAPFELQKFFIGVEFLRELEPWVRCRHAMCCFFAVQFSPRLWDDCVGSFYVCVTLLVQQISVVFAYRCWWRWAEFCPSPFCCF